jgi:hypothetical protein
MKLETTCNAKQNYNQKIQIDTATQPLSDWMAKTIMPKP